MAGNQKFPSDLLLVAGLVILTDIIVLIPVLNESFIRIVLGLLLVLFLPGYALVALLFPAKNGLEGVERAALSIGMSVAIVPLTGLALDNTSFGIREMPLLASLSVFIILACAGAYIRRKQLPENKAFEVSFKKSASSIVEVLGKPESSTEKTLRAFLAISLLTLAGATAYVSIFPHQHDPFTEFYILGPEGKADNYTMEYVQGKSETVIIGIANHEHRTVNYTLDVRLENKSLALPENLKHIQLEDNKTLEEPLEITPSIRGKDLELQFLLFNETEKEIPYEDLRLWIDVIGEA
ncbi:DUF1616 domain-containing protein [Methanosarcina mazei]|uniref:DUF1616 domain-containing protein n=1 Tax=Methanosarcina mazei TaxID=2209 RepID=A0A0F8KT30_METMZ|nr:DUF1616 domain-containing protein [Methanosarcina mazei]KKH16887.1 hypothetical protein DU48_14635 [Methanosarcina mazei]KKH18692.1 hypothetical protein DU44_04565 [Methanosarcina mazei]KKH20852.1 hypothetical protein DU65_20090 [Methanosarcina mazei]